MGYPPDPFVVIAADPAAPVVGARTLETRVFKALVNGRIARVPTGPIDVRVYSSRRAFIAGLGPTRYDGGPMLGYFDAATREVFVDASGGGEALFTLSHEMVHPLLHEDDARIPMWLDEGIASVYESPEFPTDGEIRGRRSGRRLPALRAALRSPLRAGDMHLARLFTTDATWFPARSTDAGARLRVLADHYALARYVCLWLEENGQLWPFYRAFRDGQDHDFTGSVAFTRVVGKSPEDADADWLAWAKAL